MKEIRITTIFLLIFLFLSIVSLGCFSTKKGGENMGLEGKKILMIIAPENYRDEELMVPKTYLEERGAKIIVASTKKGECTGMLGGKANADITLSEVNVDEYDAIIFVGGAGTPIIRAQEKAIEIARESVEKGKILAAICWAPTTLAKAGVLNGKKATVWLGNDPEYGMKTSEVLEKFGADYTGEGVTVDGNIITANGPVNAKAFAEEIEKALNQNR